MTCHCGGVALWHIGPRGFCRAHKEEAYREAAKDKKLQESVHGLLVLDWRRRKNDEFNLKS